MQTMIDRARAATPPFFKKMRNIGLVVTAMATAILTAPIAVPATVASVAGYLLLGGSVISVVSQLTTVEKKPIKKPAKKAT